MWVLKPRGETPLFLLTELSLRTHRSTRVAANSSGRLWLSSAGLW